MSHVIHSSRDMQRTVDRIAHKLLDSEADRATLRQELIRAYIEIQALRAQLRDDGK